MGEAAVSPTSAKRADKRIGTLILGWKFEALIGWGASARVYRARQANSNRVAAIKIISKPRSHIGDLNRTFTECSTLERLSHPNVLSLIDWLETQKHFYIITELAKDGDLLELLSSYVRKGQPLSEATRKMWFAQLVDAVAYTHSIGYAHKDIKPDNVLLDGDRVMLADWGYAHPYTPDIPVSVFKGTDGYWSPEIMNNRPHIGPEADCWSLGVTLYALMCMRLPFNRTTPTYMEDVSTGAFDFPRGIAPDAKSLISSLLNPNPLARFTIQAVQQHPFYLTGKSLAMSARVYSLHASVSSIPRDTSGISPSISIAADLRSHAEESPSMIQRRRPSPAMMTTTKLHDSPLQSSVIKVVADNFGLVRDQLEPPASDLSESSRRGSVASETEGVDFEEKEEEEQRGKENRQNIDEKELRMSVGSSSKRSKDDKKEKRASTSSAKHAKDDKKEKQRSSISTKTRAASEAALAPATTAGVPARRVTEVEKKKFSPLRSAKSFWNTIFGGKTSA